MNTQAHEPAISVIMGVRYQRPNLTLLERAVNSILNQTFTDFEFLICENGSTEAAKQKLKEFASIDVRIRLIDGTGAELHSEKLNRCLWASKGAYIARMDDDDFSVPDRFRKQVDYLLAHQEIAFVGCSVELEQNGMPAGRWAFPERPTANDFLFSQPFIHPALMLRREPLNAANGYDARLSRSMCEDYDLLLRLYQMGYRGGNMEEPLLTYTLPSKGIRHRTMAQRWNEVCTRWDRFKELGLLPKALPYVIKPIVAGLLPTPILETLKERRNTP